MASLGLGCHAPNPDFGKTSMASAGEAGGRRGSESTGAPTGGAGGAGGAASAEASGGTLGTQALPGAVEPDGGVAGMDTMDGTPGGDGAAAVTADAMAAAPVKVNGDLKKGLTLYLPLDDVPGSGVAVDLSGKRASAALRSFGDAKAAWIEGRLGTALALRGTSWNGWLDVSGTSLTGAVSQTFSVGMWIWRTETGGTLFARGAKGALLNFGLEGANLSVQMNTAAAYKVSVHAGAPVPADRWVHVAMTFDLKEVRLYVDGMIAGAAPYQQGIPLDTSSYTVGALPGSNGTVSARFTGKIDEVVLYTRALSDGELIGLAAGARPMAP